MFNISGLKEGGRGYKEVGLSKGNKFERKLLAVCIVLFTKLMGTSSAVHPSV